MTSVPESEVLLGADPPPDINGVDVWSALNRNEEARSSIIHNIDEEEDKGTWQVRWKLNIK